MSERIASLRGGVKDCEVRLADAAVTAVAVTETDARARALAAQVTSVDPSSGKVNDTITLAGENLGKGSVSAVFLSDDKDDYKATIVDQSADKIVAKVPQVKAGAYNVSIQVGDKLYIKPVKFRVEQ